LEISFPVDVMGQLNQKLPPIIAITIVLSSFQVRADSLNIEQNAFDYFLIKLDSIKIGGAERTSFDKNQNKLYFSGQTTSARAALNFSPLTLRKKDFLVIDSLIDYAPERRPWIYPEEGEHKIQVNSDFIVIGDRSQFLNNRKEGDIAVTTSNRYFHGGFYYVRIDIDIGVDWWSNEVYIKLDTNGVPVDWVTDGGVY